MYLFGYAKRHDYSTKTQNCANIPSDSNRWKPKSCRFQPRCVMPTSISEGWLIYLLQILIITKLQKWHWNLVYLIHIAQKHKSLTSTNFIVLDEQSFYTPLDNYSHPASYQQENRLFSNSYMCPHGCIASLQRSLPSHLMSLHSLILSSLPEMKFKPSLMTFIQTQPKIFEQWPIFFIFCTTYGSSQSPSTPIEHVRLGWRVRLTSRMNSGVYIIWFWFITWPFMETGKI